MQKLRKMLKPQWVKCERIVRISSCQDHFCSSCNCFISDFSQQKKEKKKKKKKKSESDKEEGEGEDNGKKEKHKKKKHKRQLSGPEDGDNDEVW